MTVDEHGECVGYESLGDTLLANGVEVPGAVVLSYDSGDGADDGVWAVGETSVYTGSFAVTQAMLDDGETEWANTVCVVDGAGDPIDVDGDGELDCSTDRTTFEPDPQLTIVKEASVVDGVGCW